jgi:type IV pilus assembly protein PilV
MKPQPLPFLHNPARRGQAGALLIEVLVAIVLCAFALLGYAAMQSRASTAEFEALQRSQALVLVEDMANRINANRANAGSYVQASLVATGSVVDCTSMTGAALDLCEWGNLIRGSSETTGGSNIGAMLGARGCITRAAGVTDRYVISVAWLGVVSTGATLAPCGEGTTDFPDNTLRRVVSATVCVARLRDPTGPVSTIRC